MTDWEILALLWVATVCLVSSIYLYREFWETP